MSFFLLFFHFLVFRPEFCGGVKLIRLFQSPLRPLADLRIIKIIQEDILDIGPDTLRPVVGIRVPVEGVDLLESLFTFLLQGKPVSGTVQNFFRLLNCRLKNPAELVLKGVVVVICEDFARNVEFKAAVEALLEAGTGRVFIQCFKGEFILCRSFLQLELKSGLTIGEIVSLFGN